MAIEMLELTDDEKVRLVTEVGANDTSSLVVGFAILLSIRETLSTAYTLLARSGVINPSNSDRAEQVLADGYAEAFNEFVTEFRSGHLDGSVQARGEQAGPATGLIY